MKIQSFNALDNNIQFSSNKYKSKKSPHNTNSEKIRDTLFITGALGIAAVGGILIARGLSLNPSKFKKAAEDITSSQRKTLPDANPSVVVTREHKELDDTDKLIQQIKDSLSKEETSSDEDELFGGLSEMLHESTDSKKVETILKNGIKKTDEISSDIVKGQRIISTFDRPINGVQSIKTTKFANGDISNVEAFDQNGNLIKSISHSYRFIPEKHLCEVYINDLKKGKTQVVYDYHPTSGKLREIAITYPDGSQRVTNMKKNIKTYLGNLRNTISGLFKKD